jgi:hypothetical protein
MAETGEAERVLREAGLLPREMPENYTFGKVREVLGALRGEEPRRLREAAEAALGLGVRGPLAAAIFVRHHLEGAHEAEVDRVSEGEGGERFAVLVYPEGEVPLPAERLPEEVSAGDMLRYDPGRRVYEPSPARS